MYYNMIWTVGGTIKLDILSLVRSTLELSKKKLG